MSERINFRKLLEQIGTIDLWVELARRLNVRFGKIQMAIHDGRPSKYANLDIRVSTDEASESLEK
jgi:hypothetical protein